MKIIIIIITYVKFTNLGNYVCKGRFLSVFGRIPLSVAENQAKTVVCDSWLFGIYRFYATT